MAENEFEKNTENETEMVENVSLLNQIDKNQNIQNDVDASNETQQNRLDFLLKQAEIFAHFVTNGSKTKNKFGKRKATSILDRSNTKRRLGEDSLDDDINETESVKIQFTETPQYINGEMRDYQIRGLNWLISLYENGINGILADEMGLGKTLQTISVLGFLKFHENFDGPFLVVCPNSTLQNWINEFNKFCPTMNAIKLIGDKEARTNTFNEMKFGETDWDACITTYEMVISEKARLNRFDWRYIVVDEAHRMKNENCQFSKFMRRFPCKNRLLLTGTPLQNNLHELWALLNYLLPDVFVSSDDFDSWFDSDDCLRGGDEIVKRLQAILKPFMLRRVKSEVEKALLPKIEHKLFVSLTELQRNAYKAILSKNLESILSNPNASKKRINNIVMELRKVTNHPYMIRGVEPEPFTTDEHLVKCCGKMMLLDRLLSKLKAQGSRVILFSQFVIMLDILDDYINLRGYKYRRLDGNTPYEQRATDIDDYNAENSEIFIYLISTRAGGLGINLATADTVIVYDSDWNPQADIQAIDRVHRIGQTKQVRIYRLVTENTVDERIVQRAEIKLRLDHMIIQQGRSIDKNADKLMAGNKLDIIRFGIDKILNDNSDLIDIDIEAILKEGAARTAEENEKLAKMGENQLRNMTLEEASSVSVYQFDGFDFRTLQKKNENPTEFSNQRPKRWIRNRLIPNQQISDDQDENTNFINIYDFQLYPRSLYDHCEDENKIDLSYDTVVKKTLMKKGFPNWNKQDFDLFCEAMVEFGRDDLAKIANKIPGKSLFDVRNYHSAFWLRGPKRIENFKQIVKNVKIIASTSIENIGFGHKNVINSGPVTMGSAPSWMPNKPTTSKLNMMNSTIVPSSNGYFASTATNSLACCSMKTVGTWAQTTNTIPWMPAKPTTSRTPTTNWENIKKPEFGHSFVGATSVASDILHMPSINNDSTSILDIDKKMKILTSAGYSFDSSFETGDSFSESD